MNCKNYNTIIWRSFEFFTNLRNQNDLGQYFFSCAITISKDCDIQNATDVTCATKNVTVFGIQLFLILWRANRIFVVRCYEHISGCMSRLEVTKKMSHARQLIRQSKSFSACNILSIEIELSHEHKIC